MSHNILLHSMAEFSSLTIPLLEMINAKSICEIGADHKGNTRLLYEFLESHEGKLVSIDPFPRQEFLDWVMRVNQVVTYIPKSSIEIIPELAVPDAWFIDGDHNYYTVYNELSAIYQLSKKQDKPSVIFLHDVSWPWARRDLYYSPITIPPDYLHPHSWDLGVHLGCKELKEGGLLSNGLYACALMEGGKHNGVLTAIEDFVRGLSEEFYWACVPAIFGLGVLFHRSHPMANQMAHMLQPFHENLLLRRLEDNRLANYLKVIESQNRLNEILHTVPVVGSSQNT